MIPPPTPAPPPGALSLSLLGPLSGSVDGRPLPLGPRKQRLVLAMLLSRPNTPVPVDVLTDAVWPDAPPRTARKNLQVYVSSARSLLGARHPYGTDGRGGPGGAEGMDGTGGAGRGERAGRERLVHSCGGYLLRVDEDELDTLRFRSLAAAGRRAADEGDPRAAAGLLRRALDLWQGPPLHGLCDSPEVAAEAERLEARCLTVHEDWAETEISLGRASVVVDGLRDLSERHPLRERIRTAWMDALHRTGRRAEALAVYDDYRQLLARELGLEPGVAIAARHRAILTGQDGADRPRAQTAPTRRTSAPRDSATVTGKPAPAAREPVTEPAPAADPPPAPPPPQAPPPPETTPAPTPAPAPMPMPAPVPVARVALPAVVPDFTGRGEQLRELLDVLGAPEGAAATDVTGTAHRAHTTGGGDGGRVVLITGGAGTGKSALAVRTARLLTGRYPDGLFHIRVRDERGAARPHAELVGELLRRAAAGGPPEHPEAPEQWAVRAGRLAASEAAAPAGPGRPGPETEHWRLWAAGHRALVVLDDVPDEGTVRELLPGAGRSSFVLTARGQLAGLAPVHRVALPPLDPDEALELLGRLIGPGRVGMDRASALRIAESCGRLPLAVRVSGMRLAVMRHLPLSEYADRLADPDAALDELVAGDVSVRARLASGWQDLSPGSRPALARLARTVHEGPFTLPEATAAFGCDERRALRAVESLIDAGVVTCPSGEVTAHAVLYELPRLTALYAREQSAAPAADAGGPASPGPRAAQPVG